MVLNPVYATWVPTPDNGTVGTSYLYVDADVGTTSTSVTCNQSAFADQFSSRWSKSRYYYTETMDSNCNQVWPIVNAPHWLWDSSQSYLQSASWPGPSTMLDIGHMIVFAGGTEGLTPMQTLPTPIYYTDTELTRLTALPTDDPLYYLQDKNLFLMPKFSNYFPNNTALKTCTRFLWETSPNTLTYANFLTQTITVHSTPAGTLTTMPLPQPTHVPGQGPSVAMPTPTKLAGAPGGPIWPGSSQGSGEQGSSSGAGAGSGGDTDSGDSGAISGSGSNSGSSGSGSSGSGSSGSNGNSRSNGSSGSNGNSDLNNPNSNSNNLNPGATNNINPAAAGADNSPPSPTNPPNLILAGSQTLRPGASPLTVSSLLISLDQAGMIHITSLRAGANVAGQPGHTPALGGGGSYPGSLGGSDGSGGSGSFGSHGASGGSGRYGGVGVASDGSRTMLVPVSVIAQFGGLDAFGVSMEVAVGGETGQGVTWSVGVGGGIGGSLGGGGVGTGIGAEGVGQRVAEMGRWIAAGLGGEGGLGWLTAGAAVGGEYGASGEGRKSGGGSQETGSGGSAGGSDGDAGSGGGGRDSAGRNGSVVAFTGGAGRIDGHSCRIGLMGLVAGCIGTALLLL